MKYTNNENHNLSIAVWLVTDEYDTPGNIKNYVSVTGLLKPIKQIVLGQRAKPVVTGRDISLNVPSRRGTAFHDSVEKAWITNYKKAMADLGYPQHIINRIIINPKPEQLKPDSLPIYLEQRIVRKINGFSLGGKYDFVQNGLLEDFKTTGVYGYIQSSNDEDYQLQGSIYRWLNPTIITENHMLIQYEFTDWNKLQSVIQKKKGYPPQRLMSKKIKLLSLAKTESYITTKLDQIVKYAKTPEPQLPECTSKELWQSDPVYKYYKNPLKKTRATRNFKTFYEAHAKLLDDGSVGVIDTIPGLIKRCGYCSSYDICTQKDQYLIDKTLVLP